MTLSERIARASGLPVCNACDHSTAAHDTVDDVCAVCLRAARYGLSGRAIACMGDWAAYEAADGSPTLPVWVQRALASRLPARVSYDA